MAVVFYELPKYALAVPNVKHNNLLSFRRFYSYLPKDYPCQNSTT